MINLFFELIQVALGSKKNLSHTPDSEEWKELFYLCQKQSLSSFVFTAIEQLNREGQKPPMGLLYQWIGASEQVKMQNALMNKEAARLTSLFGQEGHRTVILKGQANARLYPIPWSRQPGDIDICVEGGFKKVANTAVKLGLLGRNLSKYQSDGEPMIAYHHIHLNHNENGIDVEIHFRPSSGNLNPFTNKRLQAFLEKEINKDCTLVDEGFRVPNIRFALVMQIAHIQRHLISEGVGMRQIVDYYYLLKSDVNKERNNIFSRLQFLGLNHTAEALMWILHDKLGMEEEYLLAPKDERRGKMLLQSIMDGGNFGHYYNDMAMRGCWGKLKRKHGHWLFMLKFDAREAIWHELDFLKFFVTTIPERIKRRKWSLE